MVEGFTEWRRHVAGLRQHTFERREAMFAARVERTRYVRGRREALSRPISARERTAPCSETMDAYGLVCVSLLPGG